MMTLHLNFVLIDIVIYQISKMCF